MIYLIQPQFYQKTIIELIEQHLGQSHSKTNFQVRHSCLNLNHFLKLNTYFIINDSQIKDWDGMQIAKQIRKRDKHGLLILISDQIDYLTLFRSHLAFLATFTISEAPSQIPVYLHKKTP